ncbi:hypothetical protein GQ57_33160 [Burkholderia sp. MSh2]|uniref:Uncharacterized protein n=1 Tax=Burkholderia paludis TaxID=1506587 RepID=A0A6P2SHC3_9BURK|nr:MULTISPECIES: hypothetical protein [Burkholderia]KEZ01767.1 hypothetical protein GQ57_33160 [Burkholderia sp. MSh2]CAB3772238.1 hypothetical protein LMG30113_06643 [Burkholderia paludis]VWC42633.1 hypothetical protein BPA30113_07038 [Burkholderia paludis]
MAEYIPPQGVGRGAHLPNIQATYIDLHRLLAIFLASKEFADRIEEAQGHAAELGNPLFRLQECEADEISRILLSLAVTARAVDDAHDRIFELAAGPCGTLCRNVERPDDTTDLELREACNKIIHANHWHFDMEENASGRSYLTPTMYIYGSSQGGRGWKAILDVVEFAKQYVNTVAAMRGVAR